ncbi:MAG: acyl-ACP--UDP-N-acetylglucosamine O-acyltransferase [Planctomycetes bacterium]|nr:acyl-ACP--UDP-N-acetylglucosamine O-acyltransferase [Planctomycetota bacterium]
MIRQISPLAHVDPRAEIADYVEIGPFCIVGPHVTLGEACRLEGQVTVTGHTTVGARNRFFAGAVIGADPQDVGYSGSPTQVEIGDDNIFREGVTVNRGADKEDGVTRIGHRNFLMANSHVGHNCHVYNNVILCNGVLLGGHVHVHDFAIVSGNSVVHQFATLGTGSFVSGGCRAPQDVPPYMLSAGSDNPEVVSVNVVGLRRRGVSENSIRQVQQAFKLLFREHRKLDEVRAIMIEKTSGAFPFELVTLLNFVEWSARGRNGRGREALRESPATSEPLRRAA